MIRRNPVAFAMLAFLAVAVVGLLARPLLPIDETRYLAVAWEMHLSGDWLVPSKNFAPYSDKPPLLFWAINLVWLMTGVSEFTARLVVPLFCCAAIWLSAVLARRLWPDDPEIGGRTALALTGLLAFGLSGSLTMFDVPLAVATLAGLICLHGAAREVQAGRSGLLPWAGFGDALALGVLTKGPVILFHLLPAALLLPLWSGGLSWRVLSRGIGFGLLVALVMVSLWLVPAAILGGEEYRNAILWRQSAGRMAGSFAHAQPWWFYLALLPLLAFPLAWSPSLWRAGAGAPWRKDPGLRLCLIWGGAALFLFSLTSGKQAHYLVPELPALALIAARLSKDLPRQTIMPAILVLGSLAVVAALAGIGILPLGDLATLFAPKSTLLAWALLIAGLCCACLANRLPCAAQLSLGTLLVTNLLIGATAAGRVYSTHPIAEAITRARPAAIGYIGQPYHGEFTFTARLTKPVTTLENSAQLLRWGADHPHGLILGRRGAVEPPWPPQDIIRFRNRDYGLWQVAQPPSNTEEQ